MHKLFQTLTVLITCWQTGTAPAHITKDAAAHYLAKAYLSVQVRGQRFMECINQGCRFGRYSAFMRCSNCLTNPLAANFASLWSYTAPDGAMEKLPEIILSAQFFTQMQYNSINWQNLAAKGWLANYCIA